MDPTGPVSLLVHLLHSGEVCEVVPGDTLHASRVLSRTRELLVDDSVFETLREQTMRVRSWTVETSTSQDTPDVKSLGPWTSSGDPPWDFW